MSRLKDELIDYMNWLVGFTLSVSAFLLSKEKLAALFSENPIQAILSAVLLLTTVIWYFLYLKAVRYELDILDSSFDSEKIRKISGYVLPTAVGLSVFFGCLIAFTENILIYAGLAALLSSFDLYGQATTIRNINIFISEKKFKDPIGEEKAKVLFSYYIKKPLLSRISIILVTFCISFVLASYAEHLDKQYLNYVAYIAVIIVILGSEIIIHSWRRERDERLSALHDAE